MKSKTVRWRHRRDCYEPMRFFGQDNRDHYQRCPEHGVYRFETNAGKNAEAVFVRGPELEG